ncbi:MAG: trehalose-6-phosphate synthase, partial [Candidatus Omnitrophica bacterium]|nr:trehalose-6-phosphate synthase [Candidatus Omnitrophota bacterium]
MWDKVGLQKLVKDKLGGYKFIIVSNRQPFVHVYRKGQVVCERGAGGVITALDPIMRVCNGTWVASGSGEADRKATAVDGRLRVPPDNPLYTLRRVWLTKEEETGYYSGYSNEAIWPLCHTAFERPTFRKSDWEIYAKVNKKFADAVIEEIGKNKAFIFIQDYHLALVAKYL